MSILKRAMGWFDCGNICFLQKSEKFKFVLTDPGSYWTISSKLAPVLTVSELPADVVTTTTRWPRAALPDTVMLAVSEVPLGSTVMFEAETVESTAPAVVRKDNPVAPSRFAPLIVIVKVVPFEAEAGETDCTTGPVVTATPALCGAPEVAASFRRTEIVAATGAPVSVDDKRLTETGALQGATESVVPRRTETAAPISAPSVIAVRRSTESDAENGASARDELRMATCAWPNTVGVATLVALIAKIKEGWLGAVYKPVDEIVPT